jgi:DNA primase
MAGFLSPATREQIRAASDIVDVIGSYLPLKKAGANFTALCPFHKEKSPSFNVNPGKQSFHCFGCHKGGDVFAFVQEYENIGFMDAIRRLAERASIPLEFEATPGARESRHLKDQLLDIHEQLTQRWQNCLASEAAGQPARDYLARRGVSADAIKLFRLGAAPDAWDDTVNWARAKKFDLATVEKAGVIIARQKDAPPADGDSPPLPATGNEASVPLVRPSAVHYYDRFRGRLMFPICNEQGRVIGFSGRILSGDEKTAKYVNSPETLIFTKGKVLFGLDKAKRSILDAGCAVVCEGQLDVISCHSKGITHVVAPQGTALTTQHVQILRRYTDDIILCFDGDNAGRKAAARGFDELVTLNVPFRVAEIPAPEDPDSYLKKFGQKAFFDLIVKARDFFDWYLDYLSSLHDITTDRGKIAVVRSMAELLKHPQNAVLTDNYAQKTAFKIGVSYDAVRAEFNKVPARNLPLEKRENKSEINAQERHLPPKDEMWLLRYLLLYEELVRWSTLHLDANWITDPLVRQIVALRLAATEHETWHNLAEFLESCESAEQRSLVTEAVADERPLRNPETQLADVTLKLRNQSLDRQIAALTQQLSQPEIEDEQKVRLLREQQRLKQQKRSPLAALPKNFV